MNIIKFNYSTDVHNLSALLDWFSFLDEIPFTVEPFEINEMPKPLFVIFELETTDYSGPNLRV